MPIRVGECSGEDEYCEEFSGVLVKRRRMDTGVTSVTSYGSMFEPRRRNAVEPSDRRNQGPRRELP